MADAAEIRFSGEKTGSALSERKIKWSRKQRRKDRRVNEGWREDGEQIVDENKNRAGNPREVW